VYLSNATKVTDLRRQFTAGFALRHARFSAGFGFVLRAGMAGILSLLELTD
jgi:hypothetical protein